MLDCETIPDIELVRASFEVDGDDLSASKQALAQQEAKSGNSFLPLPFHKIVAISAVFADDYGNFVKVGTFPGEEERQILEGFLDYLDRSNPKLVTYNGRTFDIPLIFMRALKYNLSCPAFFEKDNPQLNKNKWENYRSRYSEQFHLDLMDVIGHFGAVRGIKLDLLCQMSGIPGKYDVSGDQVMELFYQGEIDRIRQYCESDVINTFLLYLKYELLQGHLTLEQYKNQLNDMAQKLPQDKEYTNIFKQYLQKEAHGSH